MRERRTKVAVVAGLGCCAFLAATLWGATLTFGELGSVMLLYPALRAGE